MKIYLKFFVLLILLSNLTGYSFAKNTNYLINIADNITSKIDSLIDIHNKTILCKNDSIMNKLSNIEDKSTTNYWINIIFPSAIALITALLATFLAAYLNRKAEYKKYIFQKRIDIYHEFFNELDILLTRSFELVLTSNKIRNNTRQPDQEIPWNVSKIFTPVKMKASTIYLLLNKNDKKTFTNTLDEVKENIVASCMDAKKCQFDVENHINKIKELLDTTIKDVKL